MNILVTGASGFIGSHLMKYLKKKGHLVHGLSRRPSGTRNIFTVPLDDKRRLDSHLRKKRYDTIVHLAASTCSKDPVEIFNNNCRNTLNLLESCKTNKVRRLIFASTHLVYGKTKFLPIDENHPLNPISDYAMSKLIGENICEMFHYFHDLEILILRISSVYGKGQPQNLIIPTMARNLQQNKKLTLHKYQNGFQLMDLINVLDVCNSMELACKTKIKFGIFNIATGIPITAEYIAKKILKFTRVNSINTKKILSETNHFFYDVSLAKSELGFNSKIRFDEKTLKSVI